MKPKLTFLLLILCLDNLTAQNYIAVQHGNLLSQYPNLDSAIVRAQDGDYIYIPGGVFNLTKTINKKLFIYGAGYYPDSTIATTETRINDNVTILSGSSGGLLTGIHITGYVRFGTNSTDQEVQNYTIARCKIDGELRLSFDGSTTSKSANFYISENVLIGKLLGGDSNNNLFEKNIFQSVIENFQNGGVFKNNIFLYNYSGCTCMSNADCHSVFGYYSSQKIIDCYFINNIIFDMYPLECCYLVQSSMYHPYLTRCSFDNNIFIFNQQFPYQTNFGTNNIVNQTQASIFENQSGNTFSYSHDYHLKSSCPGKNAGTDGTDIGIYGTGQPYKAGAVPANPHISFKMVGVQNNQINVNIKVSAQDR